MGLEPDRQAMGGSSEDSPGCGAVAHNPQPALGPLQLVRRCNEGAHKMERTELMYTLHTQLDFGKVKVGAPTPRASSSEAGVTAPSLLGPGASASPGLFPHRVRPL